MWKQWKQWQTFLGEGSKITADGNFSHEIKRCLLLGRKIMTNLDSLLKSRDMTLLTKAHIVKAMATHSSTLAWKIPWKEEPGRLQSMGSLRVGYNWATSLSCIGEGNGNPLQCSCLENPRDRGAWWTAVYGVAQSQTRLKQLCSRNSSSPMYIQFLWIQSSKPVDPTKLRW